MTGSQTTRFREWRRSAGLSLQEVADLTGLSSAMISLVERGERQLAPRTKVAVARRLGVAIRELFDVEPIEDSVVDPAAVAVS